MLLSESFMEIPVKVVADDKERESYQESGTNLDQESETAVTQPNWSCHEMVDFPAKMDQPASCSSNCMNLSSFIIFACSCSQFELFLDSHGCDDFLRHATRRQVVVPSVAVQQHHGDVEAYKKNDQIGSITKILIILVLHERDDFVDDHRIAHVNENVRHDADSGPEESILESNHDRKENVFVLLSIKHFFDCL